MHTSALAFAQACLSAKDLRHHFIDVGSLGNAVAMAAVRALNKVSITQSSADTGSDRFFPDVQVNEAGDLAVQKILFY